MMSNAGMTTTKLYTLSDGELIDAVECLRSLVAEMLAPENAGAVMQQFAQGRRGPTHFMVTIDRVTKMTGAFIAAAQEIVPGAEVTMETTAEGKAKGWVVSIPLTIARTVTSTNGRKGGAGVGVGARQLKRNRMGMAGPGLTTTTTTPNGERVMLLWSATAALGGLLYYRFMQGQLF